MVFNLDTEHPKYRRIKLDQWSGVCYAVPRDVVNAAIKENDAHFNLPCVYILTEHNHDEVYIGQTERFAERIKQHVAAKKFWDLAIMFTVPDGTFTGAHAGYVEASLIGDLIDPKHHGNSPTGSSLPAEQLGGAKMFIGNVKYLLESVFDLTSTFVDQNTKPISVPTVSVNPTTVLDPKEVYIWENKKGLKAEFKQLGDKDYVLLAGSIISGKPVDSFNSTHRATKSYYSIWQSITSDSSKSAKILGDKYQTLIDISFTSPSSLFSVIFATGVNGKLYLADSVVK
jgi:hypothetical protein